ncbi:MAG: hypothetical protein JW843_06865 [Candidatus Aminicenantes bacterium]|nr:hypothetical protein [Candidatus Aminicenantes bacterium]
MKNLCFTAALIAVLVFAGTACGKKDAPAETAEAEAGSTSPSAQPAPETGAAENLGKKIGSSYIMTIEQITAMLEDKLPAGELHPMLLDMKAGTIDIMVGLGKEREAMSAQDRAMVDQVLSNRITLIRTDLFKRYQDGQAHYKDDKELFNLIAEFNIITQYANFDLLKKQRPEEAKRLGIE